MWHWRVRAPVGDATAGDDVATPDHHLALRAHDAELSQVVESLLQRVP